MSIYTKAFWKATGERVIASMAGGVLAVVTADGFDVAQANWKSLAIGAGTTGAAALLKALIASTIGNNGPSLVQSETLAVNVEAVVDPESPTGAVAGEGSDIPEGTPVEVEAYRGRHASEGMGSDSKAGAAYHDGKDDDPRPDGYWDGI